jgi:hypothetical protein
MFKALEISGMDPLHVDVRYTNINTVERVVAAFKESMQHDYERDAEKYADDKMWATDYADDLADWNEGKDKITDVSECMEWLKDQSWDLWGAAPWIAELCFDKLELLKVDKAPGVGPILNVFAQGENNDTGFYCWLMYKHGFIDSPDVVYDGYDT